MPPVSGRWAAWRVSSAVRSGVKVGCWRGGREACGVVVEVGGSSAAIRAVMPARVVGVGSASMSVVVVVEW